MEPGPDLARVVATLRLLVARAGALRAVALLDRGEAAEPVVVDCVTGGEVEVVEGEDARTWDGPDDAEPLALPGHVHPFPPLEVDLAESTVQSPLGVLDHVGRIVRESASLLPGRSVLTVGFATTSPDVPVYLAARGDEPLVLSLGDAEYELPAGWPGEPGQAGPLAI
jgi:hypothetical protein